MRFGIDQQREYTLEEIGLNFDVTRERIRQIEAKAISRLRHPSRKHFISSKNPGLIIFIPEFFLFVIVFIHVYNFGLCSDQKFFFESRIQRSSGVLSLFGIINILPTEP